ncbi:MAG TPA: response regulator transcription factor [Terriglobales bacterium]|nr:response regulator transcription factor [Terriglobales bacterium]
MEARVVGSAKAAGTGRGQSRAKPAVFLVEDDQDISRLIRFHLEGAGFAVTVFPGATAVLKAAEEALPSLFLLDIMLPGGDGFELCRRIRANRLLANVPIIFVTAKTEEADRVTGLELGADDYVVKPFSPRELVARVHAALRRYQRVESTPTVKFDAVEIDSEAMVLKVAGREVATTTMEFRLLHYLAAHPRLVLSRDQLLDAVWGQTHYVSPRTVDVYVRRIRAKIEQDPDQPRYLKTVRGMGYRFELPA